MQAYPLEVETFDRRLACGAAFSYRGGRWGCLPETENRQGSENILSEEGKLGPIVTALILVCSATVAMRDCNVDTAIDVVQGPEVNSIVGCGLSSQAMIAQTSMASGLGKDQYLKIVCVQRKPVAALLHLQPAVDERD
jgi:hypothetical protein